MRLIFIIVLLLGSPFAFSREMEPGSEYYNLSVQLVRDINNLEFSSCPDWTTVISRQEFLCATFTGDARNFPNSWDAALTRVRNDFNLEDALEWSIGELGINKMYSINNSIMSVTLEPQNFGSQLVIYVAKPLTFDDFAATTPAETPMQQTTQNLQPIAIPVPQGTAGQNSLTNSMTSTTTGSNIIIQATPSNSTANLTPASSSSNPTSTFSDVSTSSVQNDFYGYSSYQEYVDAYRLKVTNPATASQPLATMPSQNTQPSTYSNSLPAYCITYPSRPECAISNQPNLAEQSMMPFPNTPTVQQSTQPSVQQQTIPQATQSFNGYPSYEAYLQAFHQRYQQDTQNAQVQSYATGSSAGSSVGSSQSFAGFPSYEAYLQDYNQRYGQAGQSSGSQAATTPLVTTPAPSISTAVSPQIVPNTTASTSAASASSSESSVSPTIQTDQSSSSSQFQVSASSLTGTTPDQNESTTIVRAPAEPEATSSPNTTSNESNGSNEASAQVLSLAPSKVPATGGVLGKISTRGFRNVPWGSTPKRTKDIETWELVDEGLAQDEAYYLAYDGEVLGAKVLAVYYFSPKTKILGRGAYIFVGSEEPNSQQVLRHSNLHTMLGEDYGEPNRNEKLWLNEEAKDLSDIEALETGELLYVTQWDDNQIDVELSLFASSDELMNRVLYSSKLFAVVIDEEVN